MVNNFGFMYESVSYAFACCLSVENKRYYYYYYYYYYFVGCLISVSFFVNLTHPFLRAHCHSTLSVLHYKKKRAQICRGSAPPHTGNAHFLTEYSVTTYRIHRT
jgi:hypothetical protein